MLALMLGLFSAIYFNTKNETALTLLFLTFGLFIGNWLLMLKRALMGPILASMVGGPPVPITIIYTLLFIPSVKAGGELQVCALISAMLYYLTSAIICWKYPQDYSGPCEQG